MSQPISNSTSSSSIPSSDSTISISFNSNLYNSSEYAFTDEQKNIISSLLKLQDKAKPSIGSLVFNIMEIMRCLKLKIDFRDEPKFEPLKTNGKFTKNEGIDIFMAIVHDIESMEIKKSIKANLRSILKTFQSYPFMDEIKQAKFISSYWVFELNCGQLLYINSSTPSEHDKIVPEIYYNSKCERILYLDLPSMIITEFKVSLNASPFDSSQTNLERAMIVHHDLNGIGTVVLAIFNHFPIDDIYICNYSHITKRFSNKLQIYKNVIVIDLDFGEYTSGNMSVLHHNMKQDEAQDFKELQYTLIDYSKNGKPLKQFKPSRKGASSSLSQLKMNINVSDHCGAYTFYHRFIPVEQRSLAQDRFVQLIDIYSNWDVSHDDFKYSQALNFMFLRYTKGMNRNVRINIHNEFIDQSIIYPFYFEMFYNLSHDVFLFTEHQLNEYKAMKESIRSFISKLNSSPIESIKKDGHGNTYFSFIADADLDNDAIAHYFLNREGLNIAYVIIIWQVLLSPYSTISLRSQSFNLFSIPGFHGHSTRGSIKWKDLQAYIEYTSMDIE